MPGVGYIPAAADGGSLKGGAPRVVWQVLGADPRTVSGRSAAQRLALCGQASHLVWNPLSGEIVQLIPIVRAACALGPLEPAGPAQYGQPADTAIGTEGRLCVQICVVAFGHRPFTAVPMGGLREIMAWLDSWGVPRTWPGGRPAPFPDGRPAVRSRRLWARGGHFGASQVPGLTATGPGAIDVERLTGWRARQTVGQLPASGSPAAKHPAAQLPVRHGAARHAPSLSGAR
jgi:hypothetical protein